MVISSKFISLLVLILRAIEMGNLFSATPCAKVTLEREAFTENVDTVTEMRIQLGLGNDPPMVDLRICDPCEGFQWLAFSAALFGNANVTMSKPLPNGSVEIDLTETHIHFRVAQITELNVALPRDLFAKPLRDALEKQLPILCK